MQDMEFSFTAHASSEREVYQQYVAYPSAKIPGYIDNVYK